MASVASGLPRATRHALGRPDQSNRNAANSCNVDAALSVWEAAVAHTRLLFGVEAALPGRAKVSTCPLGAAMVSWYAAREEVAVGTIPIVSAARALNRARDVVRQELLISFSETSVSGMMMMGAADENVAQMLAARDRLGDGAPETLAVQTGKTCECNTARVALRRRGISISYDRVALHGFDLMRTFDEIFLQDGPLVECRDCGAPSSTTPLFVASQRAAWREGGASRFPWLLFLMLNSNIPGCAPVRIRADEAHDVCVDGVSVVYRVLAVIFHRGAHFWTTLSRGDCWILYDGLVDRGVGVAATAPTGDPSVDHGFVAGVLYGRL